MESLYSLTKAAVKRIYKNNWDETKVLPATIQKELLNDWLKCDEKLLDSFEEENNILEYINSWERIKRIMSPQLFVDLMNHPYVVPNFVNEFNHVIKKYVAWYPDFKTKNVLNLCTWCFTDIADPHAPDSGDVWKRNGWHFVRVNRHVYVYGVDMLDEIHDCSNWCSRCITHSLIDIYDQDECEDKTLFHYTKADSFTYLPGNSVL